MHKIYLLALVFFISTTRLLAQQIAPSFWADIAEQNIVNTGQFDRFIFPVKSRTVTIDAQVLRDYLKTAVTENTGLVVSIPMPDGSSERFLVWEASMMHPDLQAKYPEIRCFTGKGVDDPYATIKLDITPQGFHAMTLGSLKGQVFIDPLFHGDATSALVYFKKDLQRTAEHAFECLQVAEAQSNMQEITLGTPTKRAPQPDMAGDCRKRLYRLALSCTGEYASFHGGTKPLVLAAMNTSMNRVNGVYERDFAITMQLVPKNDTLIFLSAATDPFANTNGGTMLGQNQTTVTSRIGSANYDIGHVFSTGGGGIAGFGVVCNNGSKARGVTGSDTPIGDGFDIDYVAHEMGHQFGGSHCFNNSCGGNIEPQTAMEPGSGSTIMAYAGICPPNVQNNSDDYFHAISIQEIAAFVTTGIGNNCPVKTITGNNAPTVNNVPNYTIPKSTPFALTAIGTDLDGNALTYCWEQMNQQSATMPPVSTSVNGPLFRSYDPTPSPTRYFPRLQDLVANTINTWEKLPSVARTMNFRVVVRDNNPIGGCNTEDNVTVTVSGAAGPFAVTVPNTNIIWTVGEPQAVTWNVSGSDLAPVSCAKVKISLSTDGGFTYPIVLADTLPNNGSAMVSVPNNISSTCRVKVEGVGNIFYDISNVNFRIQAPTAPTFVLVASNSSSTICAGEAFSSSINTTGLAGFNSPIDFTVSGAPVGAVIAFTPNPTMPGMPSTMSVSGLTPNMAGVYSMVVTGTSGSLVKTVNIGLTVLPGKPTLTANLTNPANGATGIPVSASLAWDGVPFASQYIIEVCPNPAFAPASSVITLSSTGASAVVNGLLPSKPYYWRVKAKNNCGENEQSAIFAFQTGGQECGFVFNSTQVPISIDVDNVVNIASSLDIAESFIIADVNVNVQMNHTWVGDLDALLVSPSNDTIQLFDRPGVPVDSDGCSGDNLQVTLDDEAIATADSLENSCNETLAFAIEGAFKPATSLSVLDGGNATGLWKLLVNDNYGGFDAGALTAWGLTFCKVGAISTAQLLNNVPLNLPNNTSKLIITSNLSTSVSSTADAVTYTLLSLPQYGTLLLNGLPMTTIGSKFSQEDINDGSLSYLNGGNPSVIVDQFIFDVIDQNNANWLYNQVFLINIVQNTVVASGTITQPITCNNGTNGQITITAAGGAAPLSYNINGTSTPNNVIGGLSAGTYSVVVTDGNGFSQTAGIFVLTNPSAITTSTSVSFDDLTITANGGTGALEYSINGMNFQTTGVFDNLVEGVYNYTVRDANGCTAIGSVAISSGTLLATATQSAPVLCFGNSAATITVNAVGGFAPYEYSIDGGMYQSSNLFTGLAAGTYSVMTRDANNTVVSAAPVTIAQPTDISAEALVLYNSVTVTASGGTGSLTYSLGGVPQSSPIFNGLSNGDYTITVTDANGCTKTVTASVAVPTLEIVSAVALNVSPCDGGFDFTLTASGGVPPLEYRVNNGNWQPSPNFNNLVAGSYTFSVMDAAGTIISTNNVEIATPPSIVMIFFVNGDDVQLGVIGSGGTAPFSFSIQGFPSNVTGAFQNLPNGAYTATVTDVNGCTQTTNFTVNYTPMGLSAAVTNVSCNGGNNGSIAAVSVAGGVAPYTYSPSLQTLLGLPAGVYTITVTDATGNTKALSVTVTEPPALSATAASSTNGIMTTVTVDALGGTPPYAYSSNGGANFQSSNTFTNVANGTYKMVVRDSKGCTYNIPDLIVLDATEIVKTWGITVLPNPSTGLFRLEMAQSPRGNMQITAFDALGRQVLNRIVDTNGGAYQTSIDLSAMPSGLYTLHLVSGAESGAVILNVIR
jgi:subtilisin-like proprotein convertase family protein